MGWFAPSYQPYEQALLQHFTGVFAGRGFSQSQAKHMVKGVLDKVINESKQQGTYDLPANMGDIVLGITKATTTRERQVAEAIGRWLPRIRAEGASDEDVRVWWNMRDVERRMPIAMEDSDRMSTYLTLVTQATADDGKAFVKLWQSYPRYGNPDDTSQASGEDRPLPFELKLRVNRYVEKRVATDLRQWQLELDGATSLNAVVRQRIREGVL
jgi:hypothetical protein